MVNNSPMTEGWYILRPDGEGQQQVGPLSWDELYRLALSGRLTGEQLVWHPNLPQWTPASAIPNLLPVSRTAVPNPPKRRRGWLIPLVAALVVVIVGGAGIGAWLLWSRDGKEETVASSSTSPGANGSTTLDLPDQNGQYPPGEARIRGLGPGATSDQPDPNEQTGLSHGTQVSHIIAADASNGGAAALLRAINAKLTASEIKQILVETGSAEVEQGDGTKVAVPAEVGGKVLRVDRAVLAAINSQRPTSG